jgi:hypothetical protein
MQANSCPLNDESMPSRVVDGITAVEQPDMIIAAGACECIQVVITLFFELCKKPSFVTHRHAPVGMRARAIMPCIVGMQRCYLAGVKSVVFSLGA